MPGPMYFFIRAWLVFPASKGRNAMKVSAKALFISVLVALIVGLALGFFPQYRKAATLTENNKSLQSALGKTQDQLAISSFAARCGSVYVEAVKQNYSIASTNASSLFTGLRKYADQASDQNVKQQLEQILDGRDTIIAGLAKGDPAVAQQLQDLFLKLRSIQDSVTAGTM